MTTAKIRIKEIQANLNEAEATDFKYLNESVQQLRHHVLYLHTTFEASIDKIIIKIILKDANLTPQSTQKKVNLSHNMRILLNEMDFAKKIKVIKKHKALPIKVIKNLLAVNQIRVYFAHPTSYRSKLLLYQEEDKLLRAYEELSKALDSLKQAGIDDRPIILYVK